MGKGFFISKTVGILGIIAGVGALATIIALSVVYSQEKGKNNNQNEEQTTSKPPTTTPIPSNKPWDKYRLPKNLVPETYNVTLWPRLTPDPTTGLYTFLGSSVVDFECVEDTDLILIHSNKLNYTEFENQLARLMSVSSVEAPAIKSSWLQGVTQYLVLELDGTLKKGHKYRLYTEFIGELADDLGGFYRSEYMEDGEKRVMATTQMQPTDARKSFPCFDEPAMKAYFFITLIHDRGTTALSNGKDIETTEINHDGQDLLKTVFERTEKMSTYLLAFIVSDYDSIGNSIDGVEIRIFARRSAIAAGQGQYALNKTGPILKFFEQYYNATYPLPKSDQIAIPDFNAGAMENWGLITYRETALLYDEAFSSNSNKEKIATIIAHELAHMWFGNLVTLRWWNDLWLNEGFASYVEYLGANNAEPEWNVTDLIVLGDIHRVFAIDALASSHPLSSKEEDIQTPAQISELFDAISYSKGASVLRMLSDFLTEDVFQLGLRSYLSAFSFGNAVYTDLWYHLQKAADSSKLELPDTLDNIMNTWVLQMGFPVVTINTGTGSVSQQHFLLDPEAVVTTPSPFNYQWIIPIKWMMTGNMQNPLWLTSKSAMKATQDQWVLANVNMVGYYRVNYDDDNWAKLLDVLQSNHQVRQRMIVNVAQILDDAFNLARAKIISTVQALNTTKYLSNERDYIPWKAALNNLDFFYLMFDRSEVYGPMQDYLVKKVSPLFEYYKQMTDNSSKVPDGHMDQYNQVNAISLACRTGLEECQNLVMTWFQEWMDTDTNRIHPNLRSTVYCNAIAAGGKKEWDFAWSQFIKNDSTAIESDKLRYALSCTKQPWLLNRYLEYTLDPDMIRKQDATATIVDIASNVVGQSLAWDFVRARWSYIFSQYGGGSFSFSNLVNGVTKRFSTEFELQQVRYFFEMTLPQCGFPFVHFVILLLNWFGSHGPP
uniref:Aminopeptidase n=1 Tax=Astatotilapia calliptera TaxID=8154 RepID=A0A3P8Q7G1_ASTCA